MQATYTAMKSRRIHRERTKHSKGLPLSSSSSSVSSTSFTARWFFSLVIMAVIRMSMTTYWLMLEEHIPDSAGLHHDHDVHLHQQLQSDDRTNGNNRRKLLSTPPRRPQPQQAPVAAYPHEYPYAHDQPELRETKTDVQPKDIQISRSVIHLQNATTAVSPFRRNARVLITNVLEDPLGIELVSVLIDRHGVTNVFGVTDHCVRLGAPTRLAYLHQHHPSFRLFPAKSPMTVHEWRSILDSTRPTHIIHLDGMQNSITATHDDHDLIFPHRASLDFLDVMAKAILQLRTQRKNKRPSVKILHVTTEDGNVPLFNRTAQLYLPSLHSMLRSVYRLNVMQLLLPQVIGPFSGANDIIADTLLLRGDGAPTASSHKDPMQLISVRNATDEILQFHSANVGLVQSRRRASMVRTSAGGSELTVAVPRQSNIVSQQELSVAWQDAATYANVDPPRHFDVLSSIIVQHEEQGNAFARAGNTNGLNDPSRNTSTTSILDHAIRDVKQRLHSGEVQGTPLTWRRRHGLFPCASECSASYQCHTDTVFDQRVMETSRNSTQDCRFVLYISDFSHDLDSLPVMSNGTRQVPMPHNAVCQIAYVNEDSPLFQSLIGERDGVDSDPAMHNGWTVISVSSNAPTAPTDASNAPHGMSEADLLLPKISPGTLFAARVEKAMYFEPSLYDAFPSLPVIYYLMAKRLDAPAKEAKWIRPSPTVSKEAATRRHQNGRVWQDAAPQRHVMLFVHTHREFASHPLHAPGKFDRMAKYVLQQRGMEDQVAALWPRRQLEYYHELWELSDRTMRFGLLDTSLLIHNLRSSRSRQLRCEWYEEHIAWRGNGRSHDEDGSSFHGFEDLSLSMIRAKWRLEGRLVPQYDDWGDLFATTSKTKNHEPTTAEKQGFLRSHAAPKGRKEFGGGWTIREE